MRYVLDDSGYIEAVSCNPIICDNKSCNEYKGAIPSGYTSLQEWAQTANIRAYKIVSGKLTYDSVRAAALEAEWAAEEEATAKDIYSTEEVKTNKVWINGKPIYRKVLIVGNTGGAEQKITVASDIEDGTDISGYLRANDNTKFFVNSILYANASLAPYIRAVYDSQQKVQLNLEATFLNTSTFSMFYLICEYTKTTDTATIDVASTETAALEVAAVQIAAIKREQAALMAMQKPTELETTEELEITDTTVLEES